MQKNKVKLFVGFLIILGMIGMPGKGFSQTVSQTRQAICIQKADGTVEKHVSEGNETALFALTKQGLSNLQWIKKTGNKKAIIKFKTPPLIQFKGRTSLARNNALSDIQSVHNKFRQDILLLENNLQAAKGLKALNSSQILKKTYKYVFNGAAVELSPETLEKVRQFSYVAAVYMDQEVHAVLNESVPLIGATKVWNEFGLTGKGIKVAIVDTGIDYKHADFGAYSSFPNAKIIGGYDCINNDNDPMDDHGHGTHVAGIVAANGVLKGVAPDVSLMAFKVLDANGYGSDSTVIDGIERAVDPDGNPQTADSAGVINLSLGGPGDADDPLSQTVDNAVDAGVVVVIAAGNSGSGYSTIGSPGLARKALTVAASDKSDQIAWFSSRGPGADFAIKPDITAPGVNILSCKMGGGSVAYDGTSMAAPHVSGAAALLLQGRPGLAPMEIKQLLMGNAINIGQNAYTQGSGRVDIYKAVKSNTLASPASLNLGFDDQSQTIWSKTETVTIKNFSNNSSAYTYSLSLEKSLPAGITVDFPSQIELNNQSQSAAFDITVTVNNNLVPDVAQAPYSYEGVLLISNNIDTFRLPFTFIKAPGLMLQFDQVPYYVVIYDKKGWFLAFTPQTTTYNAILPAKGTYDVITLFDYASRIVIRENILIENPKVVDISSSEAIHQITFNSVDHNNNPLPLLGGWALSDPTGFSLLIMGGIDVSLKFSDVSNHYFFDWAITDFAFDQSVTHQIFGQVSDGIHSDLVFSNTAAEYVPIEYTYEASSTINQLFIAHFLSHTSPNYTLSFCFWNINATPLQRNSNGEFKRTLYVRPMESSSWYFGYTYDDIYEHKGPVFDWINDKKLLISPYFLFEKDQPLRAYLAFDWSNPVFSTNNMQIRTGIGPHYWSGRMQNPFYGSEIRIYSALGSFDFFYLSPYGDFVPKTGLSYYLYNQAGQLIKNDVFPYAGDIGAGPIYETIALPAAGQYQLRIPYSNYYISGSTGQASTVLDFDTRQLDPNPPYLKNFEILSGGNLNNILTGNTSNEIKFNLLDDQTVTNASLSVKAFSDSDWQTLPLTQILNQYSASIPKFQKSCFFSLMLQAQDNSGNSFTTSWDYAFYYLVPVPKFRISGNVIYNNTGLPNVSMNGLPGNPTTDKNGFYSAEVDYNWSGTVTPTLSGYSFTPSSRNYANATTDLPDQNFTATKNSDGSSGSGGGGGGCFISMLAQDDLQPGVGKIGSFGQIAAVSMLLIFLCLMVSCHRLANMKLRRK